MSATRKPQRTFLAVTLITVLAVTSVFIVYAVILSTINGGNVSVVGGSMAMWYDEANATSAAAWTGTLSNIGNGTAWYAKLNTTAAGYNGAVTIAWTLQWNNAGTWTDAGGGATESTSVTLTGASGQNIYASASGAQSSNKNWGQYATVPDRTYRVRAVVSTA